MGLPLLGLVLLTRSAQAQSPAEFSHGLSYLTAFGPKNYSVVTLLYGVIIISLAVIAIIGILVLVGALLRRSGSSVIGPAAVPLERSGSGLAFIYVGIGITFLILTAVVVWNYIVLADVAGPHGRTAATLRITGHQWWWEVQYQDQDPSKVFTTANEIHVPVGQPVRIELAAADVIHSFWVPALSGKMDAIPGQHNVTWLQADKAGIYRGQCTEYCGHEHAEMGLLVVAEAPEAFSAWRDHQLTGPEPGSSEEAMQSAAAGQEVFMRHCAVCHTIRGTFAQGKVGPDLSHLMERRTLAAATIPNTTGNLSGWISNPQQIKPGNLMPTLTLSAAELTSLRHFLEALR